MKFYKMHGLGNDFILINIEEYPNITTDLIKNIAHRNFGIGCDQILGYKKITEQLYDLIVWNTDGTCAGVCGNGVRCFAKLLYINNSNFNKFFINVGNKKLSAFINDDLITINMGSVNLRPDWIPDQELISKIADLTNSSLNQIAFGDVGIRHLVLFNNVLDDKLEELGSMLSNLPAFQPKGININFAQIKNNKEIYINTYEYGTGFTLACGSGACVTFMAALEHGIIEDNIAVHFKGGDLLICRQDNNIMMSGPATLVASGMYYYPNK